MRAAQLMVRHSEAWVRLITLERTWGEPRQSILDRALKENPEATPEQLRDLFKSWQARRPPDPTGHTA